MLDDFGHEMEHTQSKMDNTLNKIARVMHLTSGECIQHFIAKHQCNRTKNPVVSFSKMGFDEKFHMAVLLES